MWAKLGVEMSSTPFCLGLRVVDELPAQTGEYVLRSRDEQDLSSKVQKLQSILTKNDLIKIYHIGYRPDKPIPVSRYFAEICVEIGKAEEWQRTFSRPFNTTLYHRIVIGMNEGMAERREE